MPRYSRPADIWHNTHPLTQALCIVMLSEVKFSLFASCLKFHFDPFRVEAGGGFPTPLRTPLTLVDPFIKF